jgi:hypothetical protein
LICEYNSQTAFHPLAFNFIRWIRILCVAGLAQGLNDSPAGLAAWIVEKFRSRSDCNGNIEARFSKDELLTQVMIYWATESIGSSFQPYYDQANEEMDRFILSASSLRIVSERSHSSAASESAATMDGNAKGRTLRRYGGTAAVGGGYA